MLDWAADGGTDSAGVLRPGSGAAGPSLHAAPGSLVRVCQSRRKRRKGRKSRKAVEAPTKVKRHETHILITVLETAPGI